MRVGVLRRFVRVHVLRADLAPPPDIAAAYRPDKRGASGIDLHRPLVVDDAVQEVPHRLKARADVVVRQPGRGNCVKSAAPHKQNAAQRRVLRAVQRRRVAVEGKISDRKAMRRQHGAQDVVGEGLHAPRRIYSLSEHIQPPVGTHVSQHCAAGLPEVHAAYQTGAGGRPGHAVLRHMPPLGEVAENRISHLRLAVEAAHVAVNMLRAGGVDDVLVVVPVLVEMLDILRRGDARPLPLVQLVPPLLELVIPHLERRRGLLEVHLLLRIGPAVARFLVPP